MRPVGVSSRQLDLHHPSAVGRIRRAVESDLHDLPVKVEDGLVDTIVLVVSELVTNVLRHASGPAFVRLVALSVSRVRVEVHDGSPKLPLMPVPDDDAEFGRGVQMIDVMSEAMGWSELEAGSKVVWADLADAAA